MSIFNVFLDSTMLTVSVILFATCVVIGFFGDRYFKKHGTTIRAVKNRVRFMGVVAFGDTVDVISCTKKGVIPNIIKTQNER